jgi:hypothetical protein
MAPERRDSRRPRRSRRSGIVNRILVAACLGLAFLLGVAVARTLDERPRDGSIATDVRTLAPLPQQPPTRVVTVTVTTP